LPSRTFALVSKAPGTTFVTREMCGLIRAEMERSVKEPRRLNTALRPPHASRLFESVKATVALVGFASKCQMAM